MFFYQFFCFIFFISIITLAEAKDFCEEACWSVSASDVDLKKSYGSHSIPQKFNFAKKYDAQTMEIYTNCMKPHGTVAIFNQDISNNCSQKARRFCEQECKKNDQIPSSESAEKKTISKSKSNKVWHCLCYQELINGISTLSTACRHTAKECWTLHGKISYGTEILVEGSQHKGCVELHSKHPAEATNSQIELWQSSKKNASWWTPNGCFLSGNEQKSIGESIQYTPSISTSNSSIDTSIHYDHTPIEKTRRECDSMVNCINICKISHCSLVSECIHECMSSAGESASQCIGSNQQVPCGQNF